VLWPSCRGDRHAVVTFGESSPLPPPARDRRPTSAHCHCALTSLRSVPPASNRSRSARCGRAPPEEHHGKEVYITRHGEIDAYAHEAAEQLLTYMSPEAVIRHLRTSKGILWAAQQSSSVRLFMDTLARDSKEIRKFWTKLYTQIQQQSQELSEDSDFQKNMKKNLPKELDFLLNKGKNNKKEGEGITNPPNPKFKSAPPGAPFGE